MFRFLLWAASVGASFYAGILYCGYHLIDVPDNSVVKIITFVKTVKKVSEVLSS